MSDAQRSSPPACEDRGRAARLLLIVLGVLGFVVLPGAAPASGSAGVGMRAGATAQPGQANVASRGKSSKPCPVRSDTAAISASARQIAAAPAPAPVPAVLPPGVEVRPSSVVAARPAVRAESAEAAPAGLPRGRAPPLST
ncbi:hypothetical protein [Actinomadura rudentiformis]|uniref:Uncharacterized protein n=1 Tax=Actinomadura rudentiformis TaxID=359158 RepID=A0A6H9YH08_9ACTN|nr:hypothetical protein [Actinomadura rudentiformis]KAB2345575.1 hypothetical protein F8566_26895 [Actinomadura rudentiformis]